MRDRLLIADDEADIVTMLTSFFEGKGYEVMTASDGIETLKQVEKKPDLILLDISMPGLNGLEVCSRIRDHIDCPILFLIAQIEDMDKVKGFSAGWDDYIVKPFSLAELEARVSAHLRRQARHSMVVAEHIRRGRTKNAAWEHCPLYYGIYTGGASIERYNRKSVHSGRSPAFLPQ